MKLYEIYFQNFPLIETFHTTWDKRNNDSMILSPPHSPVENWDQTTLSQVDRFLFFLPQDKLQQISLVSLLLHFFQYLILNIWTQSLNSSPYYYYFFQSATHSLSVQKSTVELCVRTWSNDMLSQSL